MSIRYALMRNMNGIYTVLNGPYQYGNERYYGTSNNQVRALRPGTFK